MHLLMLQLLWRGILITWLIHLIDSIDPSLLFLQEQQFPRPIVYKQGCCFDCICRQKPAFWYISGMACRIPWIDLCHHIHVAIFISFSWIVHWQVFKAACYLYKGHYVNAYILYYVWKQTTGPIWEKAGSFDVHLKYPDVIMVFVLIFPIMLLYDSCVEINSIIQDNTWHMLKSYHWPIGAIQVVNVD